MGEHFNYLDDRSKGAQLRDLLETHLDELSSTRDSDQDMYRAFAALEADR